MRTQYSRASGCSPTTPSATACRRPPPIPAECPRAEPAGGAHPADRVRARRCAASTSTPAPRRSSPTAPASSASPRCSTRRAPALAVAPRGSRPRRPARVVFGGANCEGRWASSYSPRSPGSTTSPRRGRLVVPAACSRCLLDGAPGRVPGVSLRARRRTLLASPPSADWTAAGPRLRRVLRAAGRLAAGGRRRRRLWSRPRAAAGGEQSTTAPSAASTATRWRSAARARNARSTRSRA